ncbi:transcription initiation factor TFIID subunit 13 [Tanacetum coccineum]
MNEFEGNKKTKRVKRNVTLEEKLKTKISNFEAELMLLNRNLLVNGRMNAQRMAEILKVKDLRWEKSKSEIDLFLSSRKPLTDVMMDMWTYDMMDYYLESDSSNVDASVYSNSGSVQIRYVSVCIGHGPVQYAFSSVLYLDLRNITDKMSNTPIGPMSKVRPSASQPSETSFKRKRRVFQKDLQHMMYGFRDDSNVLTGYKIVLSNYGVLGEVMLKGTHSGA